MARARAADLLRALSAQQAQDDPMSIFSTHPALRWAVPGVAVVAVVGGASAAGVISAQANSPLPPRTAAQLLVDVQKARLDGLSGTVVQRADLGVPALPGIGGSGSGSGGGGSAAGGSGSSDLTSLISGTHTLRVWYAGPDRTRVALLGTSGESDVIRNGKDVWLWSSQDKSATHMTLPAKHAHGSMATASPGATGLPTSPQEAADLALKAISPSTTVTTSGAANVAGRSAHELVLTPKEPASLVASVRLAIDSEQHVPLRVQVFAKGSAEPAFEVAFSSVDFGRPDAAQFAFNPPEGTKVTERTLPSHPAASHKPDADTSAMAGRPRVIGTGWGTVGVATLPKQTNGSGSGDQQSLKAMLDLLPRVSGAWGRGHLLEGKLFSAVLTDDGRVAVGAVTPERLYAALAAR
jgi:outer membrane lipoprotein-sorting protein